MTSPSSKRSSHIHTRVPPIKILKQKKRKRKVTPTLYTHRGILQRAPACTHPPTRRPHLPAGDMHPPPASAGAVSAPAPDPGYAPYPTLSPQDVAPPPPPPYHAAASYSAPPPPSGNPYVSGPAAGSVPPPKSASQIWSRLLFRFGEGFALFIYGDFAGVFLQIPWTR